MNRFWLIIPEKVFMVQVMEQTFFTQPLKGTLAFEAVFRLKCVSRQKFFCAYALGNKKKSHFWAKIFFKKTFTISTGGVAVTEYETYAKFFLKTKLSTNSDRNQMLFHGHCRRFTKHIKITTILRRSSQIMLWIEYLRKMWEKTGTRLQKVSPTIFTSSFTSFLQSLLRNLIESRESISYPESDISENKNRQIFL